MSQEQQPIRFAYWVPNVSGGLVVSKIEQRTSWDIDYNRKLAQLAERNGFDYALSQIRFTAGYGAEYQHESVAISHALLAATEKLKVIAAILPGPWHPAVVAKQLATIDQLTNGRVAVNIVSGWFKGEFTGIGEPWLEHDERYRRSEEFIRVLKGIWTEENFTFKGDFYRFHDYTLKPKPIQQPHPEIFQGGSSRAARDMASRVSDWYFTNGNSIDGIRAQVEDIRAKAAANGHSVKVGVNAFIIARDTEEEARAVLDEIIAKADYEAVNAFGDAVKQAGKASPEGDGNWAKSTFEDLVQYNDGFKTNLIGTPRQIAERIVALKAAGVDLGAVGLPALPRRSGVFRQARVAAGPRTGAGPGSRSGLNGNGGRQALASAAGWVRVAGSYPICRPAMNPLLPLRDAWFFFTRHLTTLVPLCLPWIFLESLLQQQIDEAVGPQQMGAWSLVAGLLFYPLYTAALILFMDARGRDERPRVGQLWSAALRLWPAFALLAALTSLLIVLGLSLLILPGIFVMVKLSFAEFCLVLRGRSPLQALRESFEFTRGRFFLILACSLVILLPVWSLEAWLADSAGDAVVLRVALHTLSGFFQLLLTIVAFRIYSLGPAPRNGM